MTTPGLLLTQAMLTPPAAPVAALGAAPAFPAPAGLALNPQTIMQWMKMIQDGIKTAQELVSVVKQIQGMAPGITANKDGMGVVPVDPVKQPAGPPPAKTVVVEKVIVEKATPIVVYAAVLGLIAKLDQPSKLSELLALVNLTPDSTVGDLLAALRDAKPMILMVLEKELA